MTSPSHANGYRRFALGPVALLARPVAVLACLALALLVMGLAAYAVSRGSYAIALPDLARLLRAPDTGTREQLYILYDIRMPRILIAALSGAMLGLAGAAMQSITRNGLADPGLIGVKEGASVMVLAVILLFPAASVGWRPVAGMAGGLCVALLVILIARDLSRTRFVLVGIGVSWMLSSIVLIFLTTADIRDVQTALVWMTGSLHAAGWPLLSVAAIWALAGTVILFATARASDAALLGDGAATGLGVRLRRLSVLRLAAPVLMTAASVSCVGSLGFVGLMAPHMARFLMRGNQVTLLASSALVGALLVLAADTIGRLAFAPLQIPAGIVMSVMGVPFFLLLLWRRRNQL
ncbi:iron ABC transporter [Azorhizobium oxalatiphilum]|uniref:Iron ABC transporter n=1 Tax=Azorhizobium oxalatiphilum TaxID=980631 RepID=A0A917FBY2_9HYPH|nr:iron ABC transporter permease [Azorhizobium oxalatiphilum]GGF68770.1 iron ABC transporter [Azorhizobium oxalatiphilum]